MRAGLPAALAVSLALTAALEAGFFLVTGKGKRGKKDLLLTVMANIITNPAVVLLYWLAVLNTDWDRTVIKIPLELSAVVIEGYYYKKYGAGFKRPYLFSAAANAFSFGIGAVIQQFVNIF